MKLVNDDGYYGISPGSFLTPDEGVSQLSEPVAKTEEAKSTLM